jgi:quercetin dioxygenase-like cupin family protein
MLRPMTNGSASGQMTYRLGVVDMRLLAATEDTGGEFALGEFRGAAGTWTVPHVHRRCLEAFYILDGRFTFTVGSDDRSVEPGALVLIPRDTRHVLRAEEDDGRLLVLWTPGGLEQMFVELSRLAPDALRDPETRRAIASRHDSIPV